MKITSSNITGMFSKLLLALPAQTGCKRYMFCILKVKLLLQSRSHQEAP